MKEMNKKTRIVIATPPDGGPITYTRLLEKRLPERGFILRVANFGSFLKFPKGIRHFLFMISVFLKAVRSDVVYAQDPVSTGLPAYLSARLSFKKFYLKIVGDYAWEQGSQRAGITDFLDSFSTETDKYPFLVRFLKKVQLYVASHADKIIVPSNYLKKIVTNWGVPADKITVIYNAFNPPQISLSKDELRDKLDFKGKVIISAGRLVPWKGFDTLIKSVMPRVLESYKDALLLIAGDGPDKSYLEKTIKDSGLEKNIIMLGKKPQAELFEYLKGSDVFVLNTSYEGLSHQLLEVLALETPIVTTNAGGNVEVITDGLNGVLTEFNDSEKIASSILKIFNDEKFGSDLVQNGREKLKDFGEEKMLSELSKALS